MYTEPKPTWSWHYKKNPKVLKTRTNVLTTLDAFFAIRTKPQTFYNIDGNLYEQRTSVLLIFSGEAKNLITSLRTIWESWNLEIWNWKKKWKFILPYIDINLKLRHKNNLKKFNFFRQTFKTYAKQNKTIWKFNSFFFRFTPYILMQQQNFLWDVIYAKHIFSYNIVIYQAKRLKFWLIV
jgi:hypothetical protein